MNAEAQTVVVDQIAGLIQHDLVPQDQHHARPAAGQLWDAAAYARNGRFVADLGATLLDWLAPQAGERILDLGCGDGVLTRRIAESGCDVIGADASAELVAAARELSVDARVVDGQALPFAREFDAVFSNAALHWMKRDPDAVLAGVARALKPGGRFVAELGGAGNVAAIRGALHAALARRGIDAAAFDPWYFPSAADYRARLEAAGFKMLRIEMYPRPTPLPGDVAAWLRTFAQSFLQALPPAQRDELLLEVQEALRPQLASRIAGAVWVVDYVRLRFVAVLEP
jgi:SAM-dependent methyltransferase